MVPRSGAKARMGLARRAGTVVYSLHGAAEAEGEAVAEIEGEAEDEGEREGPSG
jgi:hypothetical protein